MNINHKIKWLRISYWAGAIADLLMVILFLMPERMGEVEYRHPMGLAASLMLGWTFLLIWADRKPVERKGILLLTIFPVISGLMIAGVYGVAVGVSPISIPSNILGVTLIALMGFSYFNARNLVDEEQS